MLGVADLFSCLFGALLNRPFFPLRYSSGGFVHERVFVSNVLPRFSDKLRSALSFKEPGYLSRKFPLASVDISRIGFPILSSCRNKLEFCFQFCFGEPRSGRLSVWSPFLHPSAPRRSFNLPMTKPPSFSAAAFSVALTIARSAAIFVAPFSATLAATVPNALTPDTSVIAIAVWNAAMP